MASRATATLGCTRPARSGTSRPAGRAPLARRRPALPQLLTRARQSSGEAWESWDDAPDTPSLNGNATAAAAADADWRSEVQSLAASLRVGQVGAGWPIMHWRGGQQLVAALLW